MKETYPENSLTNLQEGTKEAIMEIQQCQKRVQDLETATNILCREFLDLQKNIAIIQQNHICRAAGTPPAARNSETPNRGCPRSKIKDVKAQLKNIPKYSELAKRDQLRLAEFIQKATGNAQHQFFDFASKSKWSLEDIDLITTKEALRLVCILLQKTVNTDYKDRMRAALEADVDTSTQQDTSISEVEIIEIIEPIQPAPFGAGGTDEGSSKEKPQRSKSDVGAPKNKSRRLQ